jgi:hypothetical protein
MVPIDFLYCLGSFLYVCPCLKDSRDRESFLLLFVAARFCLDRVRPSGRLSHPLSFVINFINWSLSARLLYMPRPSIESSLEATRTLYTQRALINLSEIANESYF